MVAIFFILAALKVGVSVDRTFFQREPEIQIKIVKLLKLKSYWSKIRRSMPKTHLAQWSNFFLVNKKQESCFKINPEAYVYLY